MAATIQPITPQSITITPEKEQEGLTSATWSGHKVSHLQQGCDYATYPLRFIFCATTHVLIKLSGVDKLLKLTEKSFKALDLSKAAPDFPAKELNSSVKTTRNALSIINAITTAEETAKAIRKSCNDIKEAPTEVPKALKEKRFKKYIFDKNMTGMDTAKKVTGYAANILTIISFTNLKILAIFFGKSAATIASTAARPIRFLAISKNSLGAVLSTVKLAQGKDKLKNSAGLLAASVGIVAIGSTFFFPGLHPIPIGLAIAAASLDVTKILAEGATGPKSWVPTPPWQQEIQAAPAA
ncbi:MAG: hypothetical protein ACQEP8_03060 [Chlamydiota bacterium]